MQTVGYKGSKRRLLDTSRLLADECGARTAFDGFSGTGIVSAALRQHGLTVTANDVSPSSTLMGQVFLEGYDPDEFDCYLQIMQGLPPVEGWLTDNYSGVRERVIRGTGGAIECRPMAYTKANAMRLDAARDWIDQQTEIDPRTRRALIFSVILAADKVFNGTNDQKSALKEWAERSQRTVVFPTPTLITGPVGKQLSDDVRNIDVPPVDFVYLDPPYTHGVLYESCYHLNNSIATWTKPQLNTDYALPRPQEICFRANGETAGGFYNRRTAFECFESLVSQFTCKRMVLSYSDAPRNVLTIDQLVDIFSTQGELSLHTIDHKICSQPSMFKQISTSLKEVFLVVDYPTV